MYISEKLIVKPGKCSSHFSSTSNHSFPLLLHFSFTQDSCIQFLALFDIIKTNSRNRFVVTFLKSLKFVNFPVQSEKKGLPNFRFSRLVRDGFKTKWCDPLKMFKLTQFKKNLFSPFKPLMLYILKSTIAPINIHLMQICHDFLGNFNEFYSINFQPFFYIHITYME